VSKLFDQLFSPEPLNTAFRERYADSRSKGIDKLTGPQYGRRVKADLPVTVSKCSAGTHRFSPYLETLKFKGRNKAPRLIAIPTVRYRLVFHQLNRILARAAALLRGPCCFSKDEPSPKAVGLIG
jgi:hypothetical protein